MGKLKAKIQDGTINIPGLILKIVLIWFIFFFPGISEYQSDSPGVCQRRSVFSGSC